MTSKELRDKYLEFFKSKGHKIIPSASLVPENDPSVLFTTAGMHPLVPYLLGEKHPLGNRLADVQKCIRTGDISEVGDNRHLTFFEMLGNWSLGDYFKREMIGWSFEFLTDSKWLGLSPERIYVTVFAGNENSSVDEESVGLWKEQFEKAGISSGVCNLGRKANADSRIFLLGADDNWWGPAGETGPCGPCSEMFYDTRPEEGKLTGTHEELVKSFRLMEIWNDVFMEFNKKSDGSFEKMAKQNVDTGMGIERTITVINGVPTVFETDLFTPIISKIEKLSGKKYEGENIKSMRIIADHVKAATFILGDEKGIAPGNTGQGYVLRRLIRRAVRYGKQIGIKSFTKQISEVVVEMYKDVYPELSKNKNFIFDNLKEEEERFEKTLENGLKEFEKGTDPFVLFTSYGFPFELTKELAKEKGVDIDENKFNEEFKKHQELSKTASSGMFKGGLSDAGEETKKLHTATHLLRQALEIVLNEPIMQKGSNINAERLRFDFGFGRKMTDEEKQKVEILVNQKISENLPVNKIVMKKEEAERTGAVHAFSEKYGDEVSIYYVGPSLAEAWSKEFCGGPHVENTSDLAGIRDPERVGGESKDSKGPFKILKEEAVSAGVRRIKAVLE